MEAGNLAGREAVYSMVNSILHAEDTKYANEIQAALEELVPAHRQIKDATLSKLIVGLKDFTKKDSISAKRDILGVLMGLKSSELAVAKQYIDFEKAAELLSGDDKNLGATALKLNPWLIFFSLFCITISSSVFIFRAYIHSAITTQVYSQPECAKARYIKDSPEREACEFEINVKSREVFLTEIFGR